MNFQWWVWRIWIVAAVNSQRIQQLRSYGSCKCVQRLSVEHFKWNSIRQFLHPYLIVWNSTSYLRNQENEWINSIVLKWCNLWCSLFCISLRSYVGQNTVGKPVMCFSADSWWSFSIWCSFLWLDFSLLNWYFQETEETTGIVFILLCQRNYPRRF